MASLEEVHRGWHKPFNDVFDCTPENCEFAEIVALAKAEAAETLLDVIGNAQLQAEGLVRVKMTKAEMIKLGGAISDGLVEVLEAEARSEGSE